MTPRNRPRYAQPTAGDRRNFAIYAQRFLAGLETLPKGEPFFVTEVTDHFDLGEMAPATKHRILLSLARISLWHGYLVDQGGKLIYTAGRKGPPPRA